MTNRPEGSPNPFEVVHPAEPRDAERTPGRTRRVSLPLRMDDGTVRTIDLPSALERPAQFSPAELERLTRAYAEALGLLNPRTREP